MLKSACGASVSVSVALLLAELESEMLELTVAVLASVPVAEGLTRAETVYVTEPPVGRLTVLLMLPDPEAVQVPPPAPTQVQVAVRLAGSVSATVAPEALLGPALLAVMV